VIAVGYGQLIWGLSQVLLHPAHQQKAVVVMGRVGVVAAGDRTGVVLADQAAADGRPC
jgi:hypothetical protein